MTGFDPFEIFRGLLLLFVTIYSLLQIAGIARQLAGLLRGSERHKQFLRSYLAVQLLTVRVRKQARELAQIGALAAVLILLVWLHWAV